MIEPQFQLCIVALLQVPNVIVEPDSPTKESADSTFAIEAVPRNTEDQNGHNPSTSDPPPAQGGVQMPLPDAGQEPGC